jgi:Zn-dependent protease
LSALPGLRFRLFGFPVTIGLDFLFVTLIIGLQARPGVYILEWVAVVAVSILIHELGHAFVLGYYSVHPEIRLWGLGGLTMTGFVLPPRKSILVSLAGPAVGIPVAVAVMVVKPWLPDSEPLAIIAGDLIFVNLWWGIVNVLPIAGLDGGHVVQDAFLLAFGQRGRTPGLITVGLFSIVIAIAGLFCGFVYLAIVVALFGFLNPEPYRAIWRLVPHGAGAGGGRSRPTPVSAPKPPERREEKRGHDRPIAVVAVDSKRAFGEAYLETVVGATGLGEAGPAVELDLDEFERRPAPLLPDVAAMVARRDDAAVAHRLGAETDPLAVLWTVTRVVEGQRVSQLLGELRREGLDGRTVALLKLQVGLHALGRFGDSMAAASILGRAGGPRSAVLEARSAARVGDRKRTAAALERAISLGPVGLSDAALGDIARLGPDRKVADLLARLRGGIGAG